MSDGITNKKNVLMDDEALVRAFQSGKKSAFDELVHRHKDRLYNLCFWILGDHQDADDAAQDVFLKIFRSIDCFRFEA